MNYLAHFLLSQQNEALIVGNFIADDVKGNQYKKYPKAIQQGILLHREIDTFTDNHPIVKNSKNLIRKFQRKYTPVVIDVFYDYFLASNFHHYSTFELKEFSLKTYSVLNKNINLLTPKTSFIFHHMSKNNWLYNYSSIEGIQRALTGLSRRTTFENDMQVAHHLLLKFKSELKTDFEQFYPELKQHVRNI
ncbi:MAG: ACP phosphodiesterase [Vicingaceae bacterium]|nr:DUF479 domain-containing protein [Flavobacteriales bacterium]MBQ19225.1 hypothetical protein [Flavobacteriales bacterium]MDF1675871.1 ACP phosphodiesterase [Vicingaceae bacterium]|tara:strand:- start:18947 stop:19519 length:573 start_codon:yes stop_codon:yes gene_type:complete